MFNLKKLFTWDNFAFLGAGIVIGILATGFFLSKAIDDVIEEKEEWREKNKIADQMLDYLREIDEIKKWNKNVKIPEELREGK